MNNMVRISNNMVRVDVQAKQFIDRQMDDMYKEQHQQGAIWYVLKNHQTVVMKISFLPLIVSMHRHDQKRSDKHEENNTAWRHCG